MSNSEKTITVIVILILIIAGYMYYQSRKNESNNSNGENKSSQNLTVPKGIGGEKKDKIEINLKARNNSNETGTATITQENEKVKIVLDMDNAPDDVTQPAYINSGTCDNIGAIIYTLTPVKNGDSESLVTVTNKELSSLRQPITINVRKSENEKSINYSCAEINFLTSQ